MLISKLLRKKNVIKKLNFDFTDLISSTFQLNSEIIGSGGITTVGEYENMRPDLIADRIYGDISLWDALLKYNGISNPFSISQGALLYVTADSSLSASYINAREIPVRDPKSDIPDRPDANPNTGQDSNRSNNLNKKKKIRPVSNLTSPTISPRTQQEADRLAQLQQRSGGAFILPPNINQPGSSNTQKLPDGRIIFGANNTQGNIKTRTEPISRKNLINELKKNKGLSKKSSDTKKFINKVIDLLSNNLNNGI
jgi:hypothetical protein